MESTNLSEFPRLTKSAVLDRSEEHGLAAQFLQSAAYSGLEAPARAIAQAVDHYRSESHADNAVQSAFKSIGVEQPKPAEFGSGSWIAQQVGGAAGMMLPFLAVRGGIQYGAGKVFGAEALGAATTLTQAGLREAALSGATGFVYGSLLTPSNDANVKTSSFYADRLKNGAGDAATFAALSMVNPFVAKGLDSTAASIESSAMPAMAKHIECALRFPVVSGMVSGIPSGLVSAEGSALKDGRLLPTMNEVKQSVGGMAVVGAAMGTATWALERATSGTSDRNSVDAQQQRQQLQTDERQSPNAQIRRDSDMQSEQQRPNAQIRRDSDIQSEQQRPNAQIRRDASEEKSGASSANDRGGKGSEAEKSQKPDAAAAAGNGDAMLSDMVDRAYRRMVMTQQGRASAVGTEETFLDNLAKSTVSRNGFLSKRNADDEVASSAPKPANPDALNADSNLPGLEIVLGASGAETTAHAGFLQAVEDNHVPVGRITGVSGGSLVAALYANKYSPAEIKDILLSDNFRYPKLDVLARCFHLTDPWNLYPYAMDFRPWLQDFVDTYKLKPQDNLRIVAADSKTHAPIVFEGTNYDLTTALSASTAATPALGLKPVEINGRTAIDGFYYHPIPAALSKAPAIVSKIGFVSKLPTEALAPWDYFLHLKEMAYYKELKDRYPDPPGNFIAQTGLSDVATTTFGISKETMEKLVQHGYDATNERLHEPDAVAAIEEARKEVAAAQKK